MPCQLQSYNLAIEQGKVDSAVEILNMIKDGYWCKGHQFEDGEHLSAMIQNVVLQTMKRLFSDCRSKILFRKQPKLAFGDSAVSSLDKLTDLNSVLRLSDTGKVSRRNSYLVQC